jgi:hypothetical protein
MTQLEELALISRMSKALDGLSDAGARWYLLRALTYFEAGCCVAAEDTARLDAAALRAQLARRSALSRKAEAA